MLHDAKLNDEPARLAALRRLEVLDTEPETPFENVVALVRTVLGVPMAAVTLIDEDRQWFKARSGLGVAETPRSVSFCTHAIRQSAPFLIDDARLDARFADNPYVTGDPNVRSYAGIPLLTPDGYNVGVLCAIDDKVRTFSPSEVDILANFARIVMNELQLRHIAERDQLTGALTRRGFIEKAEQELARFRRYHRPCCLALVDIDHFKTVNDTYGHPAGDAVLREMVASVVGASRPVDLLGRLGGEEFAVLLDNVLPGRAERIANDIRRRFGARDIKIGESTLKCTVSAGVAVGAPQGQPFEVVLNRADAALYDAKRAGRDRVEVAGYLRSVEPAESRTSA